jgi:predicted Zn-dependent protease
MGLAAFNRMRREQAAREAAEAAKLEEKEQEVVKVPEEPKEPEMGENEARNDAPISVDDMSVEQVKGFLDQMEIKYAHNTSEAKLREKLRNAIK